MTTTHQPLARKMSNGFYATLTDAARGTYTLARCTWLVQVPSGNPEPDCEADCWRIVDCGARLTFLSESGSSFRCEAGHDHVGYCEGGADVEWAREQAERAEAGR